MGLNETPSANRIHIGFFGRRNAGKSSLVNAVTGQELAVVSDTKGTTTDPVYKSMELLPLGPVMIIDTPGFDDEGDLGELRVKKTRQVLAKTDIAVLVVDCTEGIGQWEEQLIELFREKSLNYITVYNKADILDTVPPSTNTEIYVSAEKNIGIFELKELIGSLAKKEDNQINLISDKLETGDLAVLVVPIDSAAPKGRLILPQQQVIRDILDKHATVTVCQPDELCSVLASCKVKPKVVITDSQVFGRVSKDTPKDIFLTSFSILMCRYKGILNSSVEGAFAIDRLQDGDTVLISEGCTHHRQCDDIGTVKMPAWVKKYTQKDINFEFSSGTEFPDDLSKYALVIHCGACMLNTREIQNRSRQAKQKDIPMTNYGIAIAHMNGILERSIEIFPEITK